MIEQVRIRNLGVIAEAELNLSRGLTALTGETGAGKTMAVTSLTLLLGAKANPARVRAGAAQAEVEGTFLVDATSPVLERITEAGGRYDVEGDTAAVIIARHIPAKGRSRAFVGGRSVPTAVLTDIAAELVSVHGQSDQIRLGNPSQQRAAVDEFGGETITRAKTTWEQAWKNYGEAREARDTFQAGAQRAAQQRLVYRALLDKVEAVDPHPGEEETLRARARVLENAVEMYGAYSAAAEALSGSDTENGAISALGSAAAQLERVLELSGPDVPNTQLRELRERLENAEADINDIYADIAELARGTQAQPEELSTIYSRRSELAGLRKQLGMSGEEILRAAAEARAGLENLDDPAATLERLEKELSHAHTAMEQAGAALRAARAAAGEELARAVEMELPELSLPDAHFTVAVSSADPGPAGADSVTFLLAAHRGAPLSSLASGASGGELSRVMLALEVGLAARRAQRGHTFLFDEVDAGIGGRAATAVGKRLAKLAGSAQVIVVTHLAQVAAYAEHQLVVVKQLEESAARTELRDVTGPEREAELARMLSGSDTDVARAHAAELLKAASVAL